MMTQPKTTSFKDRFQVAKTAFLSIPSTLKRGGDAEILAQVRKHFSHLRIGAYRGEFEGSRDWRENFYSYMTDVDVLIVACDSSRLVGPGVLREIKAANKARKMIILFKVDDNERRPYYGLEKTGSKEAPIIRLKKREDRFKAKGGKTDRVDRQLPTSTLTASA